MPESEYVVYIEKGPVFRIEDGMVHIEDRSGKLIFRRVMSIANFKRTIINAQETLAKWQVAQMDKQPASVVPLKRRRGH